MLKNKNTYFYDTETVQLSGRDPSSFPGLSSYSWYDYKNDIDKGSHVVLSGDFNDVTKLSSFSKNVYSDRVGKELQSSTRAASSLVSKFRDAKASNSTVVGHNLNFDIPRLEELLDKEFDLPLLNSAKGIDYNHSERAWFNEMMPGGYGSYDRSLYNQFKQIQETKGKVGAYTAKDIYNQYNQFLKQTKVTGGMVDTMDMASVLMAKAEEDGIANFGGNYRTGNKMSILQRAMGMEVQGHNAGDTKLMAPVFDQLSRIFEEGASEKGFSGKSKSIFKHLEDLTSRWKEFAYNDADHTKNSIATEFSHRLLSEEGSITKQVWDPVSKTRSYQKMENAGSVKSYLKSKYGDTMVSAFDKSYDAEMTRLNNGGKIRSISEVDDLLTSTFSESRFFKTIANDDTLRTPAMLADKIHEPNISAKGFKTAAIIGTGALVAYATLFNHKPSDRINGNINPIEGMHEGGMAAQRRKSETDFGSPWQGLRKGLQIAGDVGVDVLKDLPTMLKETVSGLKTEVAHNKGWVMGWGAYGMYKGLSASEEETEGGVGRFAKNMALDMADDMLIFGSGAVVNTMERQLGNTASARKIREGVGQLQGLLESPLAKKAGTGFFGYTVGKSIGEVINKISGHRTSAIINGMSHSGVAGETRSSNTDFGSPYQGPNTTMMASSIMLNRGAASDPHNEIQPEYNNAKEEYLYKQFRASKIGLSEADMYKEMTQESKTMSPYITASANAGTALHQLMQSQLAVEGNLLDAEPLVYNRKAGITGHIDAITPLGVGDIKTVSNGIFQKIQADGKAKPTHKDQVNFYLGETGNDRGYIQYVNRDSPSQQKIIFQQFDYKAYEASLRKVQRVRKMVERDRLAGKFLLQGLPMTASVDTLQSANEERLTPQETAPNLAKNQKIFDETMSYLQTTRRGMPKYGPGKDRVELRNKLIYESMPKSMGIGLQMWNDRNQHNRM